MGEKTARERIYSIEERINVWTWIANSAEGSIEPSIFDITAHPRNDLEFNIMDSRGRKTVYIEQGIEHDLLIVFAKACIVKLQAEKKRLERKL
jgi:hypothetical protein